MNTRADLLVQLKGSLQIVRRVALAVFDGAERGGVIAKALEWVPVQGKDTMPAEPLDPQSNRERSMRDERLEACRMMMTFLIKHVDIVTHDFCRAEDKTFFGMKVETIAERLGMDTRRVERALHDLHSAGLVQSTRRSEELADGTHRGHTSIRKISMGQIVALVQMGKDWFEAQQKAMHDRKNLPPSPQQLALKALRLQARAASPNTAARSLGAILSGFARGGAPPGTAPVT